MLFIMAERQQIVLGSAPKHEIIEELLIFEDQIIKLKDGKDGVIISTSFHEFGITSHNPLLFLGRLTAGQFRLLQEQAWISICPQDSQ